MLVVTFIPYRILLQFVSISQTIFESSKKRSSVVAMLPGRQLKCSNFPGRKKEKGKRNGRKGKRRERNKEGNERRKEDRMGSHVGIEE